MLAAKMIQTVSFEKPDSAHFMAPAGVWPTSLKTQAMEIPTMPTAAPGMGSVISAAMTATNSAKKCQATGVRPAGWGKRQIPIPRPKGMAHFENWDQVALTTGCPAGPGPTAASPIHAPDLSHSIIESSNEDWPHYPPGLNWGQGIPT